MCVRERERERERECVCVRVCVLVRRREGGRERAREQARESARERESERDVFHTSLAPASTVPSEYEDAYFLQKARGTLPSCPQ